MNPESEFSSLNEWFFNDIGAFKDSLLTMLGVWASSPESELIPLFLVKGILVLSPDLIPGVGVSGGSPIDWGLSSRIAPAWSF